MIDALHGVKDAVLLCTFSPQAAAEYYVKVFDKLASNPEYVATESKRLKKV